MWVYTITQETENDGYYAWNFPKNYELIGDYYIKVSDPNYPTINDTFSYHFDTTITMPCQIIERIDSFPLTLILSILIVSIGIIAIPLIVKIKTRKIIMKVQNFKFLILK